MVFHSIQVDLIAQATTPAAPEALSIVQTSIQLAQNTAKSWNDVWADALNPTSGALWFGLIKLGLILATVSILFLVMTSGKEIVEKQDWGGLVGMFIWPLIIVFFLGANGQMMASTVMFVRGFSYGQVQHVLDSQVGEFTFKSAINNNALSSIARVQLESLYRECIGKSGADLINCWNEKAPQAQQIVDAAQQQAGALPGLATFAKILISAANPAAAAAVGVTQAILHPDAALRSAAIPIIELFLTSLQWAFVNVLEAALLLTGLFAPIAMGLSLLPFQGRPIWAWLIGFLSLFGIQIGYNILVGLTAVVLTRANAEVATDLAFLCFLAIFAPALAITIAGGGGIALYNTVNSNIKGISDLGSQLVGSIVPIVAALL